MKNLKMFPFRILDTELTSPVVTH